MNAVQKQFVDRQGLRSITLLALIWLAGNMTVAELAWAQSTWKPTIRPTRSKQDTWVTKDYLRDIPVYYPRLDAAKTTIPDSTILKSRNLFQEYTWQYYGPPWRSRDLKSFGLGDYGSLSASGSGRQGYTPTAATLQVSGASPSVFSGRQYHVQTYLSGSRAGLGDLNQVFLENELNNNDLRNHGEMRSGGGWGIGLEWVSLEPINCRLTYETNTYRSADRQTWPADNPDGDGLIYLRDEQIVEIATHFVGVDAVYFWPVGSGILGILGGAELGIVNFNIRYRIEDELVYDFSPDDGVVPGLRTGLSYRTGIWKRLVLGVNGGYRLMVPLHPGVGSGEWHWIHADGSTTQAELNFSGFFWSGGIGLTY